jgi:hypothetical protein
MNTEGRVVHTSPGRLRIQLAGHRGDRAFFEQLRGRIDQLDAVHRIDTRPRTGSVIVEYDGPLTPFLRELGEACELALQAPPAPAAAPARAAVHPASPLPYRLVSGRAIEPLHMVGLLFGAVGVFQTLRGQLFPPALTTFWYAANAWRLARRLPVAKQSPGDST